MKAEETIRKKQETVQDNKAELTETQREMVNIELVQVYIVLYYLK